MKKNLKKIMNKHVFRLSVLAVVLIVLIIAAATLLSEENRFSRDVVRGLQNGWDLNNPEESLRDKEKANITGFIDCEYKAVCKYDGRTFRNKEIEDVALRYIDAVKGCKAVIEKYDPDKEYDKFWEEFSPYYGQRIIALYDLYNNERYGIKITDDKYQNDFNNLILNGWALEKTEKLSFEKSKGKKEETIYKTELMNDSGFDLSFFILEIQLLNDKGKVVETVTAAADNIAKGESAVLQFYTLHDNVTQYCISSESCDIK